MKLDKLGLDQLSNLLKFDNRVIQHNKRLGILNESELKTHIESLPDSASNLDHVRIEDINLNGSAQ